MSDDLNSQIAELRDRIADLEPLVSRQCGNIAELKECLNQIKTAVTMMNIDNLCSDITPDVDVLKIDVDSLQFDVKWLKAAIRVLFRLIDYNRECAGEILNHLFIKKRHSRKELLERVNADVEAWHGKADFYDGFFASVFAEMQEMEGEKDER